MLRLHISCNIVRLVLNDRCTRFRKPRYKRWFIKRSFFIKQIGIILLDSGRGLSNDSFVLFGFAR